MKRVILAAALAFAVTVSAHAQNGTLTRSFVSSTGVDTNACTITAPCASFAQAYTKIGANGIVAALDPGKYGPLSITSPVTINGNGWAAITGPSGADAIDITAPSGNVTLTGLELDGANAGLHGIFLTSPLSATATLNIRDCVVSNFIGSGIAIQPTWGGSPNRGAFFYLLITNTSSLSNGQNGIGIATTGNNIEILGAINGSTADNNSNYGFDLEGGLNLTVTGSFAQNNGSYGIYETGVTTMVFRDTIATTNDSIASNTYADFYAAGPGTLALYHNTIGTFSGNNTPTYSDGTNQISGVTGSAPTIQSTY
jgi:hypothetical protein